jgi:hypothetical protein
MCRRASLQFYIVHNADGLARLDGDYTVYGHVIAGMDVVDAIADEATDKVRFETSFLHLFVLRFLSTIGSNICQDRLGTNTGKVEGKRWTRLQEDDDKPLERIPLAVTVERMSRQEIERLRYENAAFLRHVIVKMHHFTKTGSGQT